MKYTQKTQHNPPLDKMRLKIKGYGTTLLSEAYLELAKKYQNTDLTETDILIFTLVRTELLNRQIDLESLLESLEVQK